MGHYNGIYVNRRLVHHIRNWPVPPVGLEYLFVDSPVKVLTGSQARWYATYWRVASHEQPDPDEEVYVVQIQARELRDRLDAMGIGKDAVKDAYLLHVNSDVESQRNIAGYIRQMESNSDREEMLAEVDSRIDTLLNEKFEDWWNDIQGTISGGPVRYHLKYDDAYIWPFDEYADIRVVLRAIVAHVPDGKIITIDLTEDGGGCCLARNKEEIWDDPTSWDLGLEPTIVLTEGTFDAEVLNDGIRIVKPHLAPYIRFFEHAVGVEGGAGSVVRNLKSFTAAGIRNRVIALLDNDSAAYEAVSGLRGFKLPSHFAVTHYPDIQLARNYPTVGPQGTAKMNVNGLAGSIELYLGTDVLSGADGLHPVHWKGRLPGISRYQGEVADKSNIQKRFKAKVRALQSDPSLRGSQDWSGIDAILSSLLKTLSALPGAGKVHSSNLFV
ncbi:HEPN/Toprim-associated domain-containing protein [Glycomyces xiaoerkulensis]|uniref:HEPN/Toprim-associated domain-containing protein n=1 Tax=Glycomyces xiaoerkulensis TaxID=2038139 RepID=UPI0012FFFF1B|nr:HEPN/Toprim-associated domain-containing protein [Glycomyces xiaoerkulensis]